MQVAVLGLGEAGGRIAGDLAAAGCRVRGFDPARRLDGIENAESARSAVAGADIVLSVNAAGSRSRSPRASPVRSAARRSTPI